MQPKYSYVHQTDTNRIGDWLQTYTGKIFFPLDPRVEDVCLEDIAHSLSLKCRYGGHCIDFYSVAEHSVLVSRCVAPQFALWGLLHDAPEAFSSDVPRPLKKCLPDWKPMEEKIMKVICQKFNLSYPEPPEVKDVDFALTSDERMANMNPSERPWGKLPPALGVKIKCLSPKKAEKLFLNRYKQIKKAMKLKEF